MNKFLRKAFKFVLWIAIILITHLFFHTASAQCSSPTLKFHSPVLYSGTDHQLGAVYLFREVIPGVDAHIEIAGIFGGATLYNIDDSTGIGYYDAFQPYVGAAPNDTSYLDWKITFKVAGTDDDTMLACLAVTGVDVDGDGARLQEFIEAATPGSIAVDPNTILNVSFDGVRSKAISTVYNIPLIDSAHHEAMFQMNFVNISTLLYRNGAVSTWGAEQIRQTCIYFKPFFDQSTFTILPAKLISLTAKAFGENVSINWAATNEQDLKKYSVERSNDGKSWNTISSVIRGVSTLRNVYQVVDQDITNGHYFYRLRQVYNNGTASYSSIVTVNTNASANKATGHQASTIVHNTIFSDNLQLQIAATANDQYTAAYFTPAGTNIGREKFGVTPGVNTKTVSSLSKFTPGIYLMVISNEKGEKIHSSRLVKL